MAEFGPKTRKSKFVDSLNNEVSRPRGLAWRLLVVHLWLAAFTAGGWLVVAVPLEWAFWTGRLETPKGKRLRREAAQQLRRDIDRHRILIDGLAATRERVQDRLAALTRTGSPELRGVFAQARVSLREARLGDQVTTTTGTSLSHSSTVGGGVGVGIGPVGLGVGGASTNTKGTMQAKSVTTAATEEQRSVDAGTATIGGDKVTFAGNHFTRVARFDQILQWRAGQNFVTLSQIGVERAWTLEFRDPCDIEWFTTVLQAAAESPTTVLSPRETEQVTGRLVELANRQLAECNSGAIAAQSETEAMTLRLARLERVSGAEQFVARPPSL